MAKKTMKNEIGSLSLIVGALVTLAYAIPAFYLMFHPNLSYTIIYGGLALSSTFLIIRWSRPTRKVK
jgi:hypothetical protein